MYSWFDLIFCIFFTIYWFLDLYLSKNRLLQLFSIFSIVDLLSILPIYDNIIRGRFLQELDTYQFLRVLRVLRVLRLNRVLHVFRNDITKYLFKTVISVSYLSIYYFNLWWFGGIYFSFRCCWFLYEHRDQHNDRHFPQISRDYLFFGGNHGHSWIWWHPPHHSIWNDYNHACYLHWCYHFNPVLCFQAYRADFGLFSVQAEFTPATRAYQWLLSSKKSAFDLRDILILGDIWPTSLLEFLLEFYHERYGTSKKEVVILNPHHPSGKVKSILHHAFYKNRLFYLQGEPISLLLVFRIGNAFDIL